ncbi:Chimeric ERCC6-PGBD3 protein [Dictyocoela muelleri]|nr:Chimeric ERCC6-PGBD3 protein [Dictyocoela muelleri]
MNNLYSSMNFFDILQQKKHILFGYNEAKQRTPKRFHINQDTKKTSSMSNKIIIQIAFFGMIKNPVCFLNKFLNLDANLSDNIIISEKPSMIKDYDKFMGGVYVYEKMVKTYLSDRKTIKWKNKFTMYLFNLIVHNSYILYKEFYRV